MITIWVPKRLVEIDLYNVAAQSSAALAEMSEKSYRQRVAYAAQKIRDSRAKIVMLTGPSASGKTTSAHKVAEALEASGTPAHVISLDNFFKGAQYYPRLPDGTLDYENPDTLDMWCGYLLFSLSPDEPALLSIRGDEQTMLPVSYIRMSLSSK